MQRAFGVGLAASIELIARVMPGRLRSARRHKALATMASMVGALVLARAVDHRALSDEILEATLASLQR